MGRYVDQDSLAGLALYLAREARAAGRLEPKYGASLADYEKAREILQAEIDERDEQIEKERQQRIQAMKRGDRILASGGIGRYVGITKAGVQWVCYKGQNYAEMCKRFDAL